VDAAHAPSMYFLLNQTRRSCPSTFPELPSGALNLSEPDLKLARYFALIISLPFALRNVASSVVKAE